MNEINGTISQEVQPQQSINPYNEMHQESIPTEHTIWGRYLKDGLAGLNIFDQQNQGDNWKDKEGLKHIGIENAQKYYDQGLTRTQLKYRYVDENGKRVNLMPSEYEAKMKPIREAEEQAKTEAEAEQLAYEQAKADDEAKEKAEKEWLSTEWQRMVNDQIKAGINPAVFGGSPSGAVYSTHNENRENLNARLNRYDKERDREIEKQKTRMQEIITILNNEAKMTIAQKDRIMKLITTSIATAGYIVGGVIKGGK